MKKALLLIMASLVILALSIPAFADDFSVDFNSVDTACGYRDTGMVRGNTDCAISGKSIRMKCENEPSVTEGWRRRTFLSSFSDGVTVPAGNYELKLWICDAAGVLSDSSWTVKYYLTFHTDNVTNETLDYALDDTALTPVKILLFSPSENMSELTATGETKTTGGNTWVEYSVNVAVPCDVQRFAFWVTEDVAAPASQIIYADDMTLTEAAAPVTEAPATEAPATEAPATQAPATEAPADTSSNPTTADAVSVIILLSCAAVCAAAIVSKKH